MWSSSNEKQGNVFYLMWDDHKYHVKVKEYRIHADVHTPFNPHPHINMYV